MATTFPDGYGDRLVGLAQLRDRHGAKMHPEFARRLFACLDAAEGLVGIGGGWRSSDTQAANYARDPNTFAPAGRSFHESQEFGSGTRGYAAVDTVGRNGEHDRAWTWLRDQSGRFGLRTFWNVNGEPWHVQCNDIPNGVSSWKGAGRPDPPTVTLPGVSPTPERQPETISRYGTHPTNDDKPTVQLGWHGDLVRYIQQVIIDGAGGKLEVDGDYGPITEARIKDVQAFTQITVTGVVDWNGTWQILDHLAGHQRDAPPSSAVAADRVETGYYFVQRGDSPWRVADRVYGRGDRYVSFEPCDPATPGFALADHHIRLPELAGAATEVQPGERAWSIIERLAPGVDPASLLTRFHDLNGGEHRVLHPGDRVFLDVP